MSIASDKAIQDLQAFTSSTSPEARMIAIQTIRAINRLVNDDIVEKRFVNRLNKLSSLENGPITNFAPEFRADIQSVINYIETLKTTTLI